MVVEKSREFRKVASHEFDARETLTTGFSVH